MKDSINEARNKLAGFVVEKENKLISDAISHQLGSTDWKIENITDRCSMVMNADGSRIFCVDDVPLILFPSKYFEIINNDDKFTINLYYKVLY